MKIKQFFKTIPAVLALAFAGPAAAKDSGTLDVYWVDVEGGGGTLIVTPAGEAILIDTGMPGGRTTGWRLRHWGKLLKFDFERLK